MIKKRERVREEKKGGKGERGEESERACILAALNNLTCTYMYYTIQYYIHDIVLLLTHSSPYTYHQMYTTLTWSTPWGSAPLSSNSCTVSW